MEHKTNGSNTASATVFVSTAASANEINSFSNSYVNTYGRTYVKNGKLVLDHVASAVELAFVGTQISAEIYSSATLYLNVYVDGSNDYSRITLTAQTQKRYSLAYNLDDGYHTIRVVKSSEIFDGKVSVASFSADKFATIAKKSLKLEFIGDSITAGYGVLGKNGENRSVSNSDGCSSYAYLTAQTLDAAYSMVALSGICVKQPYNYAQFSDERKDLNMLAFYPRISPYLDEDYAFDYNPDVVIINLGTNDSGYLSEHPSYKDEFINDYKQLLSYVKSKNPNAYIMCLYGMMGTDVNIVNGIKTAIASMNDDKISYLGFGKNVDGAHGHPSKDASKTNAEKLATAIDELLK